MPSKKVTQWAQDFVRAGHVPAKTHWACERCGMTIHDFIKKGRLPCLA